MNRNLCNQMNGGIKKVTIPSHKKSFFLLPILGMVFFASLSFVHDGFRTNRDIQSYYIPLIIGLVAGLIISYYRNRIETDARSFERQLSKEREDAALGRAAATIAHEVRNPLNALGIGLQRLQIEENELNPEHQHLVDLMLDALRRANGIVSSLLSYARPQRPKHKTMCLDLLTENMLKLYQYRCTELDITITKHVDFREPISGDPDLLSQVVENLLKNAIEAQPYGGFLYLEVGRQNHEIVLKVRNGSFSLPPNQAERILEPYFTTKATGSGLGLPIAQRIVQAHGGHLEVKATEKDTIEIAVHLPIAPEFAEIEIKH